jgi:hypothetical protein
MPPAGIEPAIPANERLQTHALDGAANHIGGILEILVKNLCEVGTKDCLRGRCVDGIQTRSLIKCFMVTDSPRYRICFHYVFADVLCYSYLQIKKLGAHIYHE